LSLDELHERATGRPLAEPVGIILRRSRAGAPYAQFGDDGSAEPSSDSVKDSIHLEVAPLDEFCPECGAVARLWDGFAHRDLWRREWAKSAAALAPVSTRYENPKRADSPVEGFAFRLRRWEWPGDTFKLSRDIRKEADTRLRRLIATTAKPVDRLTNAGHSVQDDDEDEDPYSLKNLFRSQEDSMYDSDDDESRRRRPTDILSNILPFGGPRRRLLSVHQNRRKSRQTKSRRTRLLRLTETLLYLTLNHTTPQVAELCKQRLLQRCEFNGQEYACQPHLHTRPISSEHPASAISLGLIFHRPKEQKSLTLLELARWCLRPGDC